MHSAATLAQQRASDPNQSVWVSASAGSGKTKVLTDRVLRLLLSGVPPHKILCITYTNAAAAEMQNRIHKRLSKWVMLDEAALITELEDLTGQLPSADMVRRARQLFAVILESVPNIRIQTIHAFCQSVLARFPMEAGVKPGFKLMEDRTSRELLDIAAQRIMQYSDVSDGEMEFDERLQRAIMRVSTAMGEFSFDAILKDIINSRRAYHRMLRIEKSDVELALYKSEGFDSTDQSHEKLALDILPDENERLMLREIAGAMEAYGTAAEQERVAAVRAFSYISAPVDNNVLDDFYTFLITGKGTMRKSAITGKVDKAMPDAKEFLHGYALKMLDYKERLFALESARLSSDIMHIAATLFGIYESLKLQRGFMDYDDLIFLAHALICGKNMLPWVLFKLDGGIDHLLLDEAQDTAPMQWDIMESLKQEFFSGEGRSEAARTLFVVGDEKQSIYGFQGADVEGFVSRRHFYKHYITERQFPYEEVMMETSFRTTPVVLQAVDAVFAQDDAKRGVVSDADYTLTHIPSREKQRGRVELLPLVRKEVEENDLELVWRTERRQASDSSLQLASDIAKMIAGWLADDRKIVARGRAVMPRDIMILVTRRNAFTEYLSHELKSHGVPVAGADKMQLSDHIAVQDLMALLAFMLQPADDLSLASLLKSPLYNVGESSLFSLCDGRDRSTLWKQVHGYSGDDAAVLAAQSELDAMLKKADYISPYALYAELLYARQGRQRFVGRMGDAVGEVLAAFLEALREYETNHVPSLQGFQTWMAAGGGEINRDLEQLSNEVRILTVHKSKGLEAPIIILPDTTSVPWSHKKNQLLEDENGLVKYNPNKTSMSAAMMTEKERMEFAQKKEHNRLLYVAMTRAEDELYVMGAAGKYEPDELCWYNVVKRGIETLGVKESEDGALIYTDDSTGVKPSKDDDKIYDVGAMPELLTFPNAPKEPFAERPKAPSQALDSSKQPAALSPIQVMEWQANQKDVLLTPVERGNVIHRLLQLLPDMPPQSGEAMARALLAQEITSNSSEVEAYSDALIHEVMQVIDHPELAALFGEGSVAEASVAGRLDDGQLYSAQVDRLVIMDDEVIIADYKTGKPPRDKDAIPEYYKEQMRLYGELLAAIYPEKSITIILIYTALPIHYILQNQELYAQSSESVAS